MASIPPVPVIEPCLFSQEVWYQVKYPEITLEVKSGGQCWVRSPQLSQNALAERWDKTEVSLDLGERKEGVLDAQVTASLLVVHTMNKVALSLGS